jgi:hypothetical protein
MKFELTTRITAPVAASSSVTDALSSSVTHREVIGHP